MNGKWYIASGLLICLACFIPVFTVIYWRSHPPEDFVNIGFLQPDQPTYTAFYRSVFERGNGFSYSSPYTTPGKDNPPVSFQLSFTLLAWIWKITGGRIILTWEIFRVIFGIGFFALVFVFAREVFSRFYPDAEKTAFGRWFIFSFFAILLLGGGVAWIIAGFHYLVSLLSGNPKDYMVFFKGVERPYGDWFLCLFRNAFYPLELFHHFCFFLAAVGVLKKKPLLILSGQVLACMGGVFGGIEVSAVLLSFYAVEIILERKRRSLTLPIACMGVLILFLSYYKIFLTLFPATRSLIEQHELTHLGIIPPASFFPGYGIFLLAAPAVFLSGKFRRVVTGSREGRFLLVWIFVVTLLIQNDKILTYSRSIQPSHFTRGYLYTALVTVSLLGIYPALVRLFEKKRTIAFFLPLVLLLILIPDNILYVSNYYLDTPLPLTLTHPVESMETFSFLNSLPEQETIFCSDLRMGNQIPALTPHHCMYGHLPVTPYAREKVDLGGDFMKNRNVDLFLEKYRVTLLVIFLKNHYFFEERVRRHEWPILHENDWWRVYRTADPGHRPN